MRVPFANERRKLLGAFVVAQICTGVVLTLMTVTILGVIGPLRHSLNYHFFTTATLISVADFVERPDAILVSLWMFSTFLNNAIRLWCAGLSTAQVLGLKAYRPLVLPLAGLAVTYSIIQVENFGVWTRVNKMGAITPFLLLVGWLIPGLVLLVAVIRGQRSVPESPAGVGGSAGC